MPYATQIDITTLYSPDALFVADPDGDGIIDTPAVDQALITASAEIDGYLKARYTLPIAGTHEILKQYCVDIALYRLANSSDAATTEHRQRYEDALKGLEGYASGKTRLVLPVDPNATDPAVTDPSPNPIVVGGPARAQVQIGDIATHDIPVAQLRAGAMSFWWMSSVGEQVLVIAPDGDMARAVIVASIFAGNAPSSDATTPMIDLAGGKLLVNGDIEVTGKITTTGDVIANGKI